MSSFYPIFLDIKGKKCLVVGGGSVAERKVKSLLKFAAKVTVVAPQVSPEIENLAVNQNLTIVKARFEPSHMENAVLAIGSANSKEVNQTVYNEAEKLKIPVNIVDQPELCTFMVPSLVRRGDLSIAISTSGKSPAVAKTVRKLLEAEFGNEWGEYLEIMGEARKIAFKTEPEQKKREEMFNEIVKANLLEMIREGNSDGARRKAMEIIKP
ncbi:Precorrin-2 oxidase @ Sirohydrochlorin ferrochelatase activity of CysG [hydrothermal vent metagenome]|uniref:precorrin-2 dehydrogenase n=1 Tax=hydrothermal vent metagenome TaxID=652676 RepID=A0A3B1CBH2_9ZZZZ